MINLKKLFVLTCVLTVLSGASFAQNAEGDGEVIKGVTNYSLDNNEKPAWVAKAQEAKAEENNPTEVRKAGEEAAKLLAKMNEIKPAVLLKINHVQTVKDAEGVPIACDFDLTVYNRTKEDLVSATVEMTWKDETMKEFLEEEEIRKSKASEAAALKAERERAAGIEKDTPRLSRRGKSQAPAGSETNKDTLTFNIDITDIPSFQQRILSSRLKSDRCFLLISEAELNVRTCQTVPAKGQEELNPASRARNVECNNLFQLISSKDEQYYRDFKEIDLETERLLRASKNELIKQELEANQKMALDAMDEVSEVMKTIK